MNKCIKSKNVLDYLEMIGHIFSDKERATLIYNSYKRTKEIDEDLYNIAINTSDDELKKQILDRIKFNVDCLEKFINNDGCKYIYDVREFNELTNDYESCIICGTFQVALDYAFNLDSKSKIVKRFVFGHDTVLEHDFIGDMDIKNGEVISWSSNELTDPAINSHTPDNTRFEYSNIFIPHPFRLGDIVKDINTGKIYVVNSPNTDEEMKKQATYRAEHNFGYDDCGVSLESFDEDDCEFSCYETSPVNLEFHTIEESDYTNVMAALSLVYKGKANITYLNQVIGRFKESKQL